MQSSGTAKRPSPPAHQVQRPPMRPASVRQQAAQTAARKRRKSLVGLCILLVGVLVLGLAAWFIVGLLSPPKAAAPASVAAPPSTAASQPAQLVTSQPAAPVSHIPEATGEFDIEGIPPLYNRNNAIPDEARAALTLADVGEGQQMETQAAAAYKAMQQAAATDGITLHSVSGFRTLERQTNNYNNSIQNYLANGYTQSEAVRRTEQYYAIPGTSEHEMGLAMDIGVVDDSFANTPAYTWLQQHSTEYGFIYRYPKEYVEITHINWEPWHYRFIGVNHAVNYKNLGMNTYEDYVAYLQQDAL